MILDNNLTLSGSWSNGTWTGQTVTGTGNVVSTNVIDLSPVSPNQAQDMGMGEKVSIAFDVTTAFAGATSVECQLVIADDAAISTNVTIINSTGAIAVASLTAGKQFALNWDRSAPLVPRRYAAIRYVITGTGTAGAILANVIKDYQDTSNMTYKSGFAVS